MKGMKTVNAPEIVCGIYALLIGDRIAYVGQSAHVHKRIAVHREQKRFDSVVICEVPKKHLNAVEQMLIKLLNPPLNRKYAKAENGPLHHKRVLKLLLPIAKRYMPVWNQLTKGHTVLRKQ